MLRGKKAMSRTMQLLMATLLLLPVFRAEAAGELMVHPTRVVFEGNTRTAQIDLINSGTEPMTYRISLVRRRMTETGDFVPVDTPAAGEQFADDMIRFSPRQVVLQPRIAQAVRVQISKPAGLADGEYRTHLLFRALPPADASTAREAVGTEEGLDIQLTAIYSLSIPLLVRHGATTASVSLTDLELRRPAIGAPVLALAIGRAGTRSVYGDLTVFLRTPQGVDRVVGRANGIAVYTPNSVRRVLLPLPILEKGIPAGELRVTFSERPEQKGRTEAEARLPIR
jgi:P pilus assembly chaperone PapD